MIIVFKQLIILYVFLFLGWLISKIKKEKSLNTEVLSILIVNIFLPCKVFNTFSTNLSIPYIKEKWYLIAASLTLLLILVLVAHFSSKLLTKDKYERKVYSYSFPITNYAYLGYALIESVFGNKILGDFMFFAIPFVFYTYTFGYMILTGSKNYIKRLLNPITIAILLGVVFGIFNIKIPAFISKAISMGSSPVGPLSMILTGITLASFSLKELLKSTKAYIFSIIRLIIIPGTCYLILSILNLHQILPMVLLITCMPCGLNTIVFPKLIGEDCKPGARLALITHLLSIITLPIWLSLII